MLRRLLLPFRRLSTAFQSLRKRQSSKVEQAFDPEVLIFFNLPELALRQVFSNLDASYIFHLSLLIPDLKPVLRKAKTIRAKMHICSYTFRMDVVDSYPISFVSEPPKAYNARKRHQKGKINGLEYLKTVGSTGFELYELRAVNCSIMNPESLKWMFRFLLDMFKYDELTIHILQEQLRFVVSILRDTDTKIRSLDIISDVFGKLDWSAVESAVELEGFYSMWSRSLLLNP